MTITLEYAKIIAESLYICLLIIPFKNNYCRCPYDVLPRQISTGDILKTQVYFTAN